MDLGEGVSAEQAKAWMTRLDTTGSGVIEKAVFVDAMVAFVAQAVVAARRARWTARRARAARR